MTCQTALVKRKRRIIFKGGFIVDKAELERKAAEERKAYFKAWRASNKEKTAEHRRRYWEKKAMEQLNAPESEVKKELQPEEAR
jgi:hypothetical protein